MCHHIAVSCAEIGIFCLQGLSRHFTCHGALAVNYLIMGKYQNKVLTVRIQHTERQFSIMMAPEIRIILHIPQKIVHPAHIPFIIKAQTSFFDISCHLRPGCRFLRDQHCARMFLLENGIQML